MRNLQLFLTTLLATLVLAGCDPAGEFNLPKGDVEAGRATFVLLQCNQCHTVEGVQFSGGTQDGINVLLGGQTAKVKTYADLVTSIVHPSHRLSRGFDARTVTAEGESKMRNYNDVMTVQELIDVVAFLQSRYKIWVPEYYTY